MGFGYKREDLQKYAIRKLEDAQLLYEHKRYSNSYYLAGYAVELGLKACISRQFSSEVIPDKSFVDAIYKHDVKNLVNTAGLAREFESEKKKDANFEAAFAIVSQWRPDIRYGYVDPLTAGTMIDAIADPNHGVLRWIKNHW